MLEPESSDCPTSASPRCSTPSPAPARRRRPTTPSAPSTRTSASSPCPTRASRVLQKIAKTSVVIPAAIEFVDIAGLVKGASHGRRAGQQVPQPHPRGGRHRPGRALLRGRGHHPRVRRRRSDARHRDHQHRADARRSRVGARSGCERAGQGRQARRQGARGRGRGAGEARARTSTPASRPCTLRADARRSELIVRGFFLLTRQADHLRRATCKERDLADRRHQSARASRCANTCARTSPARRSSSARRSRATWSTSSPDEAQEFLEGTGRDRERRRRADPRDLPPARPAHLLHRRREGSPRLDDPRRRHRAQGGRRHPLRLRARLHQGRDRRLRRPGRRAARSAAAREKGLYRMEGKEYVVKDGDVLLFKFNV